MNTYKRHRVPPDIISCAVLLYHRFNLSHRDIEDLLAGRGITVSREAIRLWCIKFGPKYARHLKRKGSAKLTFRELGIWVSNLRQLPDSILQTHSS